MAGRFRFTPSCCCGELAPEECTRPCVPACAEIFAGTLNYTVREKDSIPSDAMADGTFIQTDDIDSYESYPSGCLFFSVVEGDGGKHYAVPSQTKVSGNHIYGFVQYQVNGRVSSSCFSNSSTLAAVPVDSRIGSVCTVSTGSPVFVYLADSFLGLRSYDRQYHARGTTFFYHKVFCLPFDTIAEPLCFRDGERVELSAKENFEDYYVPVSGDRNWGCEFHWSTACANGGNMQPTAFASAKGLDTLIAGTAQSWHTPALDYQVFRLYGFAPPDERSAVMWTDTAVSAEFVVSYAETSGGTIVPVILADWTVSDFSLTASAFDDHYNHSGHPDYPAEILAYSGSASTSAKDARVVFGSDNTTAFNAVNTPGSPNECPTRWQTPRETSLPHNAATLNNQRFNGIWWVFSAQSPCGRAFPEQVTHGTIWGVPAGVFELAVSQSDWDMSTYKVANGATYPSAPLTFKKACDSMSYAELHQGVTQRNQYNNGFEYFVDVMRMSTSPNGTPEWVRPYIVKPAGKFLRRLIWRAWLNPLKLIGRNSIPPSSANDFETAHNHVEADSFGDLNDDSSNQTLPSTLKGYKVNVGGMRIVHPYPVQAAHYNPDLFDYTPNNQYTDAQGWVTNYAADHGILECEASVNGDSFRSFGPVDDPTGELTDTLYFPKMSQAKVAQLFGGSLTGLRVAAYGPDANFAWSYFESPITFIPHYNLDYIAVWGDE